MKKAILALVLSMTVSFAQDAAGTYNLTGVDVLYTWVSRYDVPITVTDVHGFGVQNIQIANIPQGAPFTTYPMQLPHAALQAFYIDLNVTLNEDGTGEIADGSMYPDVNTDWGTCVVAQQVLPVAEAFLYSSMGNMMEYVGMAHPGVNVLGLPGISPMAGQQIGGLALANSSTFEDFPMFPAHPTACSPAGECFPFTIGDYDGDGILQIYPDVNAYGIPEYVPGGAPLTGLTAGYFLKEGLNSDEITSVYPGNTDPSFYLEWHGVDGEASGLGWGDYEEVDEDGDGTWFDRIVGLPAVTATIMNPACGFNQAIWGDVSAAFEAAGMGFCVDHVDVAVEAYLMDPSGDLAIWGNFLTANGVIAQQLIGMCVAAGGLEAFGTGYCIDAANSDDFVAACDYAGVYAATYGLCMQAAGPGWEATCADLAAAAEYYTGGNCAAMPAVAPSICASAGAALADGFGTGYGEPYDCSNYITAEHMYGADDSGFDLDAACLADGDPLDCEGRLTTSFDGACVGILEAREVIAEFVEIESGCQDVAAGDANTDSAVNVLDVVAVVSYILDTGTLSDQGACNADANDDGNINVLDVVAIVNIILGGRVDTATSADINIIGNEVTMEANGYVGAVQMTLTHGEGFELQLTNNAMVADYNTKGDKTTLIIVAPTSEELFTANSEFLIESVIAAATSEGYINTNVNMLTGFEISTAYPNPFNPTTNVKVTLNDAATVSVNVFNLMGQHITTLHEGYLEANSVGYDFPWDASNASSGVYFIKTEVGTEVHKQKVMLLK